MDQEDNYELFVKLLTSNESYLRSFVRKLLTSSNDLDDIMQEISVTLWKKFSTFDPDTNFLKWAYVISRFKVYHYYRNKKHDRLQFYEEVLELIAEEVEEQSELSQKRQQAMKCCINKLPGAKRDLIVMAYQPNTSMKQLAEKLGKSSAAVYKTVSRLRMLLFDCINSEVARGSHE